MSMWSCNSIVHPCAGKLCGLLAIALLAFALPSANVAAHGPEIVLGSEPPNGSLLEQSPELVIVHFDTELSTTESSVQVLDGEGRQVDRGDGGVDLHDPEHASLTVTLPALSHGAYTVRWRAAVFEDDDIVEGQSTFTVGMRTTAGMTHDHMAHNGTSPEGMPHADVAMLSSVGPADIDTATTQASEHGQYRISFKSVFEPIAVNRMHSWVVHVESTDGRPVDGAAITVSGGMPEHDHGLPTAPEVTQYLGNGDYLLEGLKFHMNGWWIVTLAITNGRERDRVTFHLVL